MAVDMATEPAWLLAAAGGAGAVARHAMTVLPPTGARAATLAANVLGCLLIGAVLGADLEAPAVGLVAWVVAFCGGLTTFSAVVVQADEAGRSGPGRRRHTVAWLLVNVLACLVAVLVARWFSVALS